MEGGAEQRQVWLLRELQGVNRQLSHEVSTLANENLRLKSAATTADMSLLEAAVAQLSSRDVAAERARAANFVNPNIGDMRPIRFVLANAGYFRLATIVNHDGESWHNYALCRQIAFQVGRLKYSRVKSQYSPAPIRFHDDYIGNSAISHRIWR